MAIRFNQITLDTDQYRLGHAGPGFACGEIDASPSYPQPQLPAGLVRGLELALDA